MSTQLVIGLVFVAVVAIVCVVGLLDPNRKPCCSADLDADEPHDPTCLNNDITPVGVLSHGCLWGVINPAGAVVATATTRAQAERTRRQAARKADNDGYRTVLVCPAHPEALHAECDADTDADLPLILVAENHAQDEGDITTADRRTCGPCRTWATQAHRESPLHLITLLNPRPIHPTY
ncbi:hypothetical protein [Micromonospora haikouensis]|uniref:hypothetical protein n=1 Tax=Micromonospora haikouensis TaxID=686309 RepID=UPI003D74B58D